uniref:helix-turn-helix domain-containing protein n=1 Tax=Candidatus Fimivicinus sp. TaxID=3056640 RepID=UPI003FF077D5
MNNQKKIGAFIAQARERQGISREELARDLHVDEAEIAAWEDGSGYPALAQAPALARELSVSLDELFNARYHTVAEEYQAPEEIFLPESCSLPETEAESRVPEEIPSQEETTPAPEERTVQPKLPRWAKIFFGVCLALEGAAGCLLILCNLVSTVVAVLTGIAVAAAAAMIFAAAYLYGKQPQMRKLALLLPTFGIALLLFFLLFRRFT